MAQGGKRVRPQGCARCGILASLLAWSWAARPARPWPQAVSRLSVPMSVPPLGPHLVHLSLHRGRLRRRHHAYHAARGANGQVAPVGAPRERRHGHAERHLGQQCAAARVPHVHVVARGGGRKLVRAAGVPRDAAAVGLCRGGGLGGGAEGGSFGARHNRILMSSSPNRVHSHSQNSHPKCLWAQQKASGSGKRTMWPWQSGLGSRAPSGSAAADAPAVLLPGVP